METQENDGISYLLYVIGKIKEGKKAAMEGKTITIEELKKEIKHW